MNSRAKGAKGERELANLLKSQGHNTIRGQQFCGLNGNADVVGINGVHIECKRVERFTDEPALQQAERDARKGEIPVVMYRRNREQWKVLLRQNIADIIWRKLTDQQKMEIYDEIKSGLY